jgi:Protein of unknown function (DUF2892)
MKKNMGSADKIIRVIIAVAIAILYFTTDYISGTLGIILLVLAGIFFLTSVVGTCPLYLPFGIDTGANKKP